MRTSVETAASGSLEPKRAASTVPTHRNVERLLTGPIGATLWRLAAPNTIGFLVGNGVAVAELWFVGQLGIHSLAGLGSRLSHVHADDDAKRGRRGRCDGPGSVRHQQSRPPLADQREPAHVSSSAVGETAECVDLRRNVKPGGRPGAYETATAE